MGQNSKITLFFGLIAICVFLFGCTTLPVCGNNVCEIGETSITCPADCNSLDNNGIVIGGGGGPGGGGGGIIIDNNEANNSMAGNIVGSCIGTPQNNSCNQFNQKDCLNIAGCSKGGECSGQIDCFTDYSNVGRSACLGASSSCKYYGYSDSTFGYACMPGVGTMTCDAFGALGKNKAITCERLDCNCDGVDCIRAGDNTLVACTGKGNIACTDNMVGDECKEVQVKSGNVCVLDGTCMGTGDCSEFTPQGQSKCLDHAGCDWLLCTGTVTCAGQTRESACNAIPGCSWGSNTTTTYYVTPGGYGSRSGFDWANALAGIQMGKKRGAIYYVAGGSYGTMNFTVAPSGTILTTIKKATVFDHGTNVGWSSSFDAQAIFDKITFGSSYWVLDGQVGGGPGNWKGDNSKFGFKVSMPASYGPVPNISILGGTSNITLRHIAVLGNKDSTGGGASANDLIAVGGIAGDSNNPASNITISNAYLDNAGRELFNVQVNNMLVENVYGGNYTSTQMQHASAFSAWPSSNITIANSVWADIEGTGGLMFDNTGYARGNFKVYGNVFIPKAASFTGDGIIATWMGDQTTVNGVEIYNNTFIGNNGSTLIGFGSTRATGVTFKNNLIYNTPNVTVLGAISGYNHWVDTNGQQGDHSNSTVGTGNPFKNYPALDFTLTSNTQPGITLGSPYNVDPLGKTRTTWTRGAYEYNGPPATLCGATGGAKCWYVDSSIASSGDGTSWTTALKNITDTNRVSLGAGDFVYISGGPAGSARDYAFDNWSPVGGSDATHKITYLIGQDSAHNGTARFIGSGGGLIYSRGTLSNFTISGDAGDGKMHFVDYNHGYAIYANNGLNFKISYIDFNNSNGIIYVGGTASEIEIDHLNVRIQPPTSQFSLQSFSTINFNDTNWDQSSAHDNIIYVPIETGTFMGYDGFDWTGNGFSIYNNKIIAYGVNNNSLSGHPDGIQTLGGSYQKIYNNYIEGFTNYDVFIEPFSQALSNIQIYNNVMVSPSGGGGLSGGIMIGFDNPTFNTADRLIVANNTLDGFLNRVAIYMRAYRVNVTATNSLIKNNVIANSNSSAAIYSDVNIPISNNAIIDANTAQADFVRYIAGSTNNDYHLTQTASQLLDKGANLSTYFNTDKEGITRPQGSAWDIGAYEGAYAQDTNAVLCGTAARNYIASETAFNGTFCLAGTPSPAGPIFPAMGASVTWICGASGGATVSCTATRGNVSLCGSAAQDYYSTATGFIGAFCNAGTPAPINPTFPAHGTATSWNCILGSSIVTCNASSGLDGSCGSAAKNYRYNEPFPDGNVCATGTPNPSVPGGPPVDFFSMWTCNSIYFGFSPLCEATRDAAP